MSNFYLALVSVVAIGLAGCVATPEKKVIRKDGAPTLTVEADKIPDAIPQPVTITRAGNKNPYTVFGKTYHLLPTSDGYVEHGIASWYGTKFQGRPTANGERYNLYAMTAAHRTLPIPSYVKVRNLENGRTAIVRVNDRGPFHGDRIIDLSYAAAVKLGYADKGTARVNVEAISANPAPIKNTVVNADSDKQLSSDSSVYFLQVGAFKSQERADKLKTKLLLKLNRAVTIKTSEPLGYYQVRIGPLMQLTDVQQISGQLLTLGLERPHLIAQ